MARGGPDFGSVAPRTLTTPVLDMGELAVRLGSAVSFDRRGTVIAALDGPQLGKPRAVEIGTTARVDVVPSFTLFGSYSLRMFVSAVADEVETVAQLPFLGESGIGLETVWRRRPGLDAAVSTSLVGDDNTTRVSGAIRWNEATSRWQYWTATPGWSDTPTQPADPAIDPWLTTKVAVDLDTGLYLYAHVSGEDMGLRGITADSAAAARRELWGRFRVTGSAAPDTEIYLDSMIFTVNEI